MNSSYNSKKSFNTNNLDIIKQGLKSCFVTNKDHILYRKSNYEFSSWMFDFKKMTMDSRYLDAIAEEFVDIYKDKYPFSIGGMEVSSIPIISAILQKMQSIDMPVKGFFIRKGRKKYDLLNIIEGSIDYKDNVIIIDDGFNSGGTLLKVLSILSEMDIKAKDYFCVLNYKNDDYISDFENKNNINIFSLFKTSQIVPDLKKEKSIFEYKKNHITFNPYKRNFRILGASPMLYYIVPKSGPVLYNGNIYYGSDDGVYRCVDKQGVIVWEFKMLMLGQAGKSIFSTAKIVDDKVCFGAYDGLLYCLDANNGKLLWKNYDCDWIGSSPDYDAKNNRFVVGCEYGFWAKKGGVLAVNADTGDTVWVYRGVSKHVHASPLYIKKYNSIICGANGGDILCLDAKNGKIIWQSKTSGDIKYRFGYDNDKYVYCADFDGNVTCFNIKNGRQIWNYKMFFGSYCQPIFYKNILYVTSFDKNVYALDSKTGSLIWSTYLNARIFSSVYIYNDQIFVGNNEGIVYILNIKNGDIISKQIVGDRITNQIVISDDGKNMFVLDYANTLFSFELK